MQEATHASHDIAGSVGVVLGSCVICLLIRSPDAEVGAHGAGKKAHPGR